MEVIARYGTPEQKSRWLKPLLDGKIRSAFLMTEPDIASSDASNIKLQMDLSADKKHWILNGSKWWSSGAGDDRCQVYITMARSSPNNPDKYKQQSVILVAADTPGITIERMLSVYGYDDAPHGHGHITFTNCKVPVENMVLGEGRGFEIIQGRLGPGRVSAHSLFLRQLPLLLPYWEYPPNEIFAQHFSSGSASACLAILPDVLSLPCSPAPLQVIPPSQHRTNPLSQIHHAMRAIGAAERALEFLISRINDPLKMPFGAPLSSHGVIIEWIARSRMEIDASRLIVLNAAIKIDQGDAKSALKEIAEAKILVPSMALAVVDRAVQAHGAMGVCQDTPLANMWAHMRTLRIADGPDEVGFFSSISIVAETCH